MTHQWIMVGVVPLYTHGFLPNPATKEHHGSWPLTQEPNLARAASPASVPKRWPLPDPEDAMADAVVGMEKLAENHGFLPQKNGAFMGRPAD